MSGGGSPVLNVVASEGHTEKLKEVRKSYKYLNHANNNVLVRRTFIKTNY